MDCLLDNQEHPSALTSTSSQVEDSRQSAEKYRLRRIGAVLGISGCCLLLFVGISERIRALAPLRSLVQAAGTTGVCEPAVCQAPICVDGNASLNGKAVDAYGFCEFWCSAASSGKPSYCGDPGNPPDLTSLYAQWDCTGCVHADSPPTCFPGAATVQLNGRGRVPIASIVADDEILVESVAGSLTFEPVLSFLHAGGVGRHMQHVIVSHSFGEFRVSANHVVFVAVDGHRQDKLAAHLVQGDHILVAVEGNTVAKPSEVSSTRLGSSDSGMFAPLTAAGTIVVDGVVASNYGSAAPSLPLRHAAMHGCFWIVRAYHRLGIGSWWGRAHPAAAGLEMAIHPVAAVLLRYLRLDQLLNGLRLVQS